MDQGQPILLLISCKLLRQAELQPQGSAVFRQLAKITRSGVHLLLTAAEPDQWFPTRGNTDDVLAMQGQLQQQLQDNGGDLDGIYYVPRSVFTQDRNRQGALTDILGRYGAEGEATILISHSKAFVKAAGRLGLRTLYVDLDDKTADAMLAAFKSGDWLQLSGQASDIEV